jgi:hypothetical protein
MFLSFLVPLISYVNQQIGILAQFGTALWVLIGN